MAVSDERIEVDVIVDEPSGMLVLVLMLLVFVGLGLDINQYEVKHYSVGKTSRKSSRMKE